MRWYPVAAFAVLAVVLTGCADPRGAPGKQTFPAECAACHGSADSPAPPVDTTGSSDTASRGVGAHAAHLAGGTLGAAISCDTCHDVPATVKSPGHMDHPRPAGIVFSGLAVHGGAVPSVDQGGQPLDEKAPVTCSGVYCHGATLAGGKATSPVWNGTASAYTGCDACHGNPPPAPHPQATQCSSCHADTVGADGKIANASLHIDGKVDVKQSTACNACHGSDENPAPPKDAAGRSDTSLVSVGAHQTHLKGSARFGAVACSECHAVPAPGSLDHVDGSAAVAFGTLASADSAVPAWTSPKCSGVYCHGSTLSGGSLEQPDWTKVDGTQAACGTCHGNPPPAPHIQSDACGQCHGETIGADGAIAHPEKHGDGKVDVSSAQACNACHGSEVNSAPPKDTAGKTATTEVTVGAHQAHLADSALSSAVQCKECHPVPLDAGDAGHMDGAIDLAFGTLATTDGAAPAWDATAATCSATYCHGGTLSGGTRTTPVWNQVDGTQVACGSCHGLPPAAPHPAATNCRQCHGDTIGTDGKIAHPENHIDGKVQVIPIDTCNACHGSTQNSAPPKDLAGNTATTEPTVGAHQSHVNASALSVAITCSECHKVPDSVSSPGHLDDGLGAELTFGTLAQAKGAAPSFDVGASKCSGVYCHGSTLSGGTLKDPTWTKVDGTQVACGTCHGYPPLAPHTQATDCATCHPDTADEAGKIKDPTRHINGKVEVGALSCNACHGNADNSAPPKDTNGSSDTTEVTVGAHQSHLKAGISAAVACQECHPVPATIDAAGHDDGTIDLAFGTLSKADAATPAWNGASATCSGVYCHGATLKGGSATGPLWTKVDGTQSACGACHGYPPPAPHPQNAQCETCHSATAGVSGTIANPAKHIDGTVQIDAMACNACHGNADNAAPPTDTHGQSVTTLATVGAHQAHLKANKLTVPIACEECHVVPATVNDPGHMDKDKADVTFGVVATADGAKPAWDTTAATCSGVYCHGGTLGGGSLTKPLWTKVDGKQASCGNCHGLPPTGGPFPHAMGEHSSYGCSTCHTTVSSGFTIGIKSQHVNGKVEAKAEAKNCTMSGCHD